VGYDDEDVEDEEEKIKEKEKMNENKKCEKGDSSSLLAEEKLYKNAEVISGASSRTAESIEKQYHFLDQYDASSALYGPVSQEPEKPKVEPWYLHKLKFKRDAFDMKTYGDNDSLIVIDTRKDKRQKKN
jgi:hypothetical protein